MGLPSLLPNLLGKDKANKTLAQIIWKERSEAKCVVLLRACTRTCPCGHAYTRACTLLHHLCLLIATVRRTFFLHERRVFFYMMYVFVCVCVLTCFVCCSLFRFFVLVWSLTAMYFSKKMVRLVLLLSPAASVLGGIAVSGLFGWAVNQIYDFVMRDSQAEDAEKKLLAANAKEQGPAAAVAANPEAAAAVAARAGSPEPSQVSAVSKRHVAKAVEHKETPHKKKEDEKKKRTNASDFGSLIQMATDAYREYSTVRLVVACMVFFQLLMTLPSFYSHSHHMAEMLSNPSIILRAQTQVGISTRVFLQGSFTTSIFTALSHSLKGRAAPRVFLELLRCPFTLRMSSWLMCLV